MRIAYVTIYDPHDVKNWSGLGYFIWRSLAARGIEIEFIGPLPLPFYLRKLNLFKWHFYQHTQDKFFWADGDLTNVRAWSRAAAQRIKNLGHFDAVVSATILPVAFLPKKIPLVAYSDSTLRSLFETYPIHQNMADLNYRHADEIEFAAHRRASALVYASEWAAQSARNDYSTAPEKIHVVPFGANLEKIPSRNEVEQTIGARDRKQLNLLFLGVDWQRKGGPLALAVTQELNRIGIPAHLTVIGCQPPLKNGESEHVTVFGFVEKNSDGQKKIHDELSRSHFLIVPSLAECFGIVYAEASAFGVPSIACDVGGVASAVRNGRNGQRFAANESPAPIARWIAEKFSDFENYRRLALSSREEFESHLNWDVAGENLERILQNVIAQNKNGAK